MFYLSCLMIPSLQFLLWFLCIAYGWEGWKLKVNSDPHLSLDKLKGKPIPIRQESDLSLEFLHNYRKWTISLSVFFYSRCKCSSTSSFWAGSPSSFASRLCRSLSRLLDLCKLIYIQQAEPGPWALAHFLLRNYLHFLRAQLPSTCFND